MGEKYPTKQKDRSRETSHLTFDEKNALWYIGGYKKSDTSIKNADTDKDDLQVVLDSFGDADHDELGGSTDCHNNDDVSDTHYVSTQSQRCTHQIHQQFLLLFVSS